MENMSKPFVPDPEFLLQVRNLKEYLSSWFCSVSPWNMMHIFALSLDEGRNIRLYL